MVVLNITNYYNEIAIDLEGKYLSAVNAWILDWEIWESKNIWLGG